MTDYFFGIDLPSESSMRLLYPTLPPLARNLKFVRNWRCITQEQLARSVGMSVNTLGRAECGRGYPKLATLKRIAKVLNCSLSTLLQGE